MINIIWMILIFIGIFYGLITNNLDVVNSSIVDSTKVSLDMLLKIFPVLALWMGLTKIAERSGLLEKLSKGLSPFLTKLKFDSQQYDCQYIRLRISCHSFWT